MENPKREQHQRESAQYLRKVGERYVFDAASLIYRHKTAEAEDATQSAPTANNRRNPFWVDVRRDWLVVSISAITILLLVLTVHYSRRQWIAANKSAKAAEKTLWEIQKQTNLVRQQIVGTQAAIVDIWPSPGIESPPEITTSGPGSPGFNIAFKNDGHVAAMNLEVKTTIERILLPSNKPVGFPVQCDLNFPVLGTGDPKNFQCSLAGLLDARVWQSVKLLEQTIAVNGSFVYWNGFGEQIKESVCLRFIPQIQTKYGLDGDGNFVSCDRLPATIDRLRKRMAGK